MSSIREASTVQQAWHGACDLSVLKEASRAGCTTLTYLLLQSKNIITLAFSKCLFRGNSKILLLVAYKYCLKINLLVSK